MQERYGIRHGHVETVHSTPTIRTLIDNYHRASAAVAAQPLNMVMTSTGAAKAVAKTLPSQRAS